jgi:hypothetical protein
MKKKVYIASPYTRGDKLQLVRIQIDAFHILMDLGFIPIAPLLFHYINEVRERPHGEWLEYDLEIIATCQMMIRIRPRDEFNAEIPSTGADRETIEATKLGLEYYEVNSAEEIKTLFNK